MIRDWASEKQNLLLGVGLAVLLCLGCAGLIGRQWLRDSRNHVVIEASNISDIETIFVNCRFAGKVGAKAGERPFDLGYLRPDDRVSISATNIVGKDATFGFRGTSNGREIFHRESRRAHAAGGAVEPAAVFFAETYSADGAFLGDAGCQDPAAVSDQLSESYTQLPDDATAPPTSPKDHLFERQSGFKAFLDWFGLAGPIAFAVIGVVVALVIPMTRAALTKLFSHPLVTVPAALGVTALASLTPLGLVEPIVLLYLGIGLGFMLLAWAALVLVRLRVKSGGREASEARQSVRACAQPSYRPN